ncbi:MAG: hypothetical protein PVG83_00395 [Acidimicrobiia bacterium]|jgi:hypothetical protein
MSARITILAIATGLFVLGTGTLTTADSVVAHEAGSAGSLTPVFTFVDATPSQEERLATPVGRYVSVGLRLPDLEVVFHPNRESCGGARGLFRTDQMPWQIAICSDDVDVVFEHELAHAWERANVSEELRERFMEENGYTAWRSKEVPWNERAVEGIALVIQQGVSGLPLPPALGRVAVRRLRAFEMLAGRPDPRLATWIETRGVACEDRPTALSLSIPDANNLVCGGEMDPVRGPHSQEGALMGDKLDEG